MTKVKCHYCEKKFVTSAYAKSHADIAHPELIDGTDVELKRKGWATPYGFGDWTSPITYEQACKEMKKMSAEMFAKATPNQRKE